MTSGPFVIGVAEQLRHPGTQRRLSIGGVIEGLETSAASVPGGADIDGAFTVEAMSDHAVTVKGSVRAPWVGECRRCLRSVDGVLTATVEEVFESRPIDGETYPLDGDRVDLEPLVRDAVLLSLPLAPLCDEACSGPEPEAHPIGTTAESAVDPRWSALGDLKFE
ncbi:MAG TPA: DUF177 domain-containing protein [Acidimicrobiales bacterium]|nr:DUF177 domain-containing protein [Acidimicrobiales bacterium]